MPLLSRMTFSTREKPAELSGDPSPTDPSRSTPWLRTLAGLLSVDSAPRSLSLSRSLFSFSPLPDYHGNASLF